MVSVKPSTRNVEFAKFSFGLVTIQILIYGDVCVFDDSSPNIQEVSMPVSTECSFGAWLELLSFRNTWLGG